MKGNTSLQLEMSPALHLHSWAPGTAAGENLRPFPLPNPSRSYETLKNENRTWAWGLLSVVDALCVLESWLILLTLFLSSPEFPQSICFLGSP